MSDIVCLLITGQLLEDTQSSFSGATFIQHKMKILIHIIK